MPNKANSFTEVANFMNKMSVVHDHGAFI